MKKPHSLRMTCVSVFFLFAAAAISPAQTFTTLVNYNGANGAEPRSALIQATDGNFYGTTEGQVEVSGGTVFRITPSGTLTALYTFCSQPHCADGEYPEGGLVQAIDGDFYGTTSQGGSNALGTIFKITMGGVLSTLHSFDNTDGNGPFGALVLGSDGDFYGTTQSGGNAGDGTVFKITPSGTLTTLHNFDGSDGYSPWAWCRVQMGIFMGQPMAAGPTTTEQFSKSPPGAC